MKSFWITFLCSLFILYFVQAKRGIEEALFTWTDSPSTTLNVIWLVEEDEPTRFTQGQEGEKIDRQAEVYRQSFYEKSHFLLGDLASDVKNARFSLLKDADVEACRYGSPVLVGIRVYCVKVRGKEFKARTLPTKRPDRISFVTGGDMMHKPKYLAAGVKAMASRSRFCPTWGRSCLCQWAGGGTLAQPGSRSMWIMPEQRMDYLFPLWSQLVTTKIGGYGQTPKEAPCFSTSFHSPRKTRPPTRLICSRIYRWWCLIPNHTRSVESQTEFLESSLKKRQNNKHSLLFTTFLPMGSLRGLITQSVKV